MSCKQSVLGTIYVKLFDNIIPITTGRFRQLINAMKMVIVTNVPNSMMHCIIYGCATQGGIIVTTDERGHHSVFADTFPGG